MKWASAFATTSQLGKGTTLVVSSGHRIFFALATEVAFRIRLPHLYEAVHKAHLSGWKPPMSQLVRGTTEVVPFPCGEVLLCRGVAPLPVRQDFEAMRKPARCVC